ncbi:hypothetical protein LC612_34675 [Nostoc sp. CHAB 5834]|nr:hypothetical protein [Nostoc sp. CHAB 5834]
MQLAHALMVGTLALISSALAATPPTRLGVTTHFSQGWPISLLDRANAIGGGTIRNSLHWPVIGSIGAPVTEISNEPVIVENVADIRFEKAHILAIKLTL